MLVSKYEAVCSILTNLMPIVAYNTRKTDQCDSSKPSNKLQLTFCT